MGPCPTIRCAPLTLFLTIDLVGQNLNQNTYSYKSQMHINNDNPLKTIAHDRFRRGALVEMVARSIQGVASKPHPCVVYGLYGKWGEGKTTILNFVEEQLRKAGKEDRIAITHFNPWLVGGEEALLREFFMSISEYPDEHVRQFIKQYGSLAILVSKTIVNAVAPGVGSVVAGGLESAKNALLDSEPTIYQLKQKVAKAIKSSKKHLLVIIDDLDRLDKNEVHCVLRLIRQVADFENVVYLVAMDVEMVSKAIAQHYGVGDFFDGRKYIDKIVQVPITIPAVPKQEFERLVQEDLAVILNGYASKKEKQQICADVAPLMRTRRELLRYCNQLTLVLPGLKDEVNTSDLCILEAIKNVSYEAYQTIYYNRSVFFHELDSVKLLIDKDKETEAEKNRFEKTLEAAVSSVEPSRRKDIRNAIQGLFTPKEAFELQKAYDEKRICTSTYFMKYFTQLVPSDIIPDTELDGYMQALCKKRVDDVAEWIDEKNEQYGIDEVERALLYFVQHGATKEDMRKVASQLSISLSISTLGRNKPYHVEAGNSITSFVAFRLLQRYFTEQDPAFAGLVVRDEKLLSKTLVEIFDRAELNFSMNLLPSLNSFLSPKEFDFKKSVLKLVERFKAKRVEEQMRYSKFLLQVLFIYWKSIDKESFNDYAFSLVEGGSVSVVELLEHFIEGPNVADELGTFVSLFEEQLEIINQQIKDLQEADKKRKAVKWYCANYKVSLENLKAREDGKE